MIINKHYFICLKLQNLACCVIRKRHKFLIRQFVIAAVHISLFVNLLYELGEEK